MASAQSAVAILKQVMAKASSASAALSMASSAVSSAAVSPTASSTTSTVVVSASARIQQFLAMPLPSVISVQDEGERIIGGVAIQAREGTKRKPRGRSTDSQKRRPRTCKRRTTFKGVMTVIRVQDGTHLHEKDASSSGTDLFNYLPKNIASASAVFFRFSLMASLPQSPGISLAAPAEPIGWATFFELTKFLYSVQYRSGGRSSSVQTRTSSLGLATYRRFALKPFFLAFPHGAYNKHKGS